MNIAKLRETLRAKNLPAKKILVFGDTMLDQYFFGMANRISPEAPVPIVTVTHEKANLGGAGNVARNIASLGNDLLLVCVLGADEAGKKIIGLAQEENIKISYVVDDTRPTTIKTRIIAQHQQIVRVDKEKIFPISEPIQKSLLHMLEKEMTEVGVIVLSDYGKGLFPQSLYECLLSIITKYNKDILVLVDPKPSNTEIFKNSYLLTPNLKEAALSVGSAFPTTRDDIIAIGQRIIAKIQCRNLLITLGPDGMVLFKESNEIIHIPTCAQRVFDVTGAGDTVIATLAFGLNMGCSLLESCLLANYAAGYVVGELGASAITQNTLCTLLESQKYPEICNWS